MKYIYIGYWRWDDNARMPGFGGWLAPHYDHCLGVIDLRSNTECSRSMGDPGLGIFSYDAPFSDVGIYLGDNPRSILTSLDREQITALLKYGESVISTTPTDLIFEVMNNLSDPTGIARVAPLMPDDVGLINIHLGGFGKIYEEVFKEAKHPHVIDRFKLDYTKIREGVLDGSYPSKIHRKFLSVNADKLGINWRKLIPAGLPEETPLTPSTIIEDGFNRTNSSTLGTSTSGFTWTYIEGSAWKIDSNTAAMDSTTGGNQFVRADSALSSADHYALHTANTVNLNGSWEQNMGVLVRKDNTSTVTFYGAEWSALSYWRTFKMVGGSYSGIGSNTSVAPANGDQIKLRAAGTTITRYKNGVSQDASTDSSISSNLYCGVSGNRSGGQSTYESVDNFVAGDTSGGSPSSSASPSSSISPSSSVSPSRSPSLSPSVSPSVSPSTSPSNSPSNSPSVSPSVSPSTSPSNSPSNSPSISPSASVSPSLSPSSSASPSSSSSPSESPSNSPSESPSISPSSSVSPSSSYSPSSSESASNSPSPSPEITYSPTVRVSGQVGPRATSTNRFPQIKVRD